MSDRSQVIPLVLGEALMVDLPVRGSTINMPLDSMALLQQLLIMVLAPTALGAAVRALIPGVENNKRGHIRGVVLSSFLPSSVLTCAIIDRKGSLRWHL